MAAFQQSVIHSPFGMTKIVGTPSPAYDQTRYHHPLTEVRL